MDLLKKFKKNGYVIIPNLISHDKVKDLRNDLYEIFNSNNSKRLESITLASNDKRIYKLQFKSKIQEVCNEIFNNDYYFVNDWQIQYNMFGVGGSKKGWHVDCGSEITEEGKYLFDSAYNFGKIGIYLQNNTFDYGGAIDIIPKSHKFFFQTGFHKLNLLFYRISNLLLIKSGIKKTLKLKAGDAVIFDSRLLHRSTPPSIVNLSKTQALAGRSELSKEKCKYSIYWEVGNKESVNHFMKNSEKRAKTEFEVLEKNEFKSEVLFNEYLSYSFPKSYSSDYVKKVNEIKNLNIASVKNNKLYEDRMKSIETNRVNS
jgi:hypothetical protein